MNDIETAMRDLARQLLAESNAPRHYADDEHVITVIKHICSKERESAARRILAILDGE